MKKFFVFAFLLIFPANVLCGEVSDSVKSVGKGLIIGGSAGNNPVSAAISALGGILSLGGDLFSGGTFNQDELLKNAALKWDKPKSVLESKGLLELRNTSGVDAELSSKISAAVDQAKAEAVSGHFTTNHRLGYISLMHKFDKGEWILIAYPVNNASTLTLWCNKESASCILGTFAEHVDLPTFRETSENLKRALNGATVTFDVFDAYEPNLSKLKCGLIGSVTPFTGGAHTFPEAIRRNILKEILDASGYSSGSKVKINGKLNKIDISVLSPEWNFDLELISSNGKKMVVKEQYKFDFSFWSNSNKCQQLAAAFGPAVRYLSEKIVKDPSFPELFKP